MGMNEALPNEGILLNTCSIDINDTEGYRRVDSKSNDFNIVLYNVKWCEQEYAINVKTNYSLSY